MLGLAWMEATGGLGVEDSLGTAENVFNNVIGWFTFIKKTALASLYRVIQTKEQMDVNDIAPSMHFFWVCEPNITFDDDDCYLTIPFTV